MDLPAVPVELVVAALAALTVVALGPLALRAGLARLASARVQARARAGEHRAEALLAELGYEILGRQVAERYAVGLDGALVVFELRADYLVAWDRRRFVAEVKTGQRAPRLDTAATRRQLLEYRVAFDVDGVLLVDVEASRVHEVVFPLPLRPQAAGGGRLAWLAVGVVVGALVTLAAVGLRGARVAAVGAAPQADRSAWIAAR